MSVPLNLSHTFGPSASEETFPLSQGQEGIWFMEQMHRDSGAYNVPEAWELHGPINCEALQVALNELTLRHETLRTRFELRNGKPVQIVSARGSLPLQIHDLRGYSGAEQEASHLLACNVEAPFDLQRAPLGRAVLIRIQNDRSILLINLHHIISDAWSFEVLRSELFQLYRCALEGRSSDLAPLPVQFVDFVLWQRDAFRRPLLNQHVEDWKKRLSGAPESLALGYDRSCALPSLTGATVFHHIPEQLSAEIQTVSLRHRVSLYNFLLSSFFALLHRYTGESDIVVGSPFSGRTRSEIEGLIGYFVNTHALRVTVRSEQSFLSLLNEVRTTVLAAEEIQDASFTEIVERLGVAGGCRHPVFQVVFGMENEVKTDQVLPGTRGKLLDVATATSKFDLTLLVAQVGKALRIRWEFSADLLEERTIRRMARQLEVLLASVCRDPECPVGELRLADESELSLIQQWGQGPAALKKFRNVVEAFESQADLFPEKPAVIQDAETRTYRQINSQANSVAAMLVEKGITPGQRVGLCMDRSPALIVCMLGVLKAGGVFVPLDCTNPPERMAFIAEDTELSCVLADEHGVRLLSGIDVPLVEPDGCLSSRQCADPANTISEEDPAYIMFTSGSTGIPKGVVVPHRAILRLVLEPNYISITSEDVFLQLAPVSFDASTLEIWGALLNGARLVLPPPQLASLSEVAHMVKEHRVTTLWLTAGLFHQMVDFGLEHLIGLRNLLAGGEELSVTHVSKAMASLPGTRLINGYGPTENTTFTCCFPVPTSWIPRKSVPIGRPVNGTNISVLDENLKPVPVGVPGELYAGGDGLALGYWKRTDLNNQSFRPIECAGLMYRTGDRVRWLDDGTIEFLGRVDQQVKIRGFRVEPGEVEAALSSHPLIRQAFVAARQSPDGSKVLAAYYVPRNGEVPGFEKLQEFLSKRLPGYMVPTFLTPLDAFPLNANGKVDWRSLPEPRQAAAGRFSKPQTRTERVLADIFCEVLGMDQVSSLDNFFRLGGHSLLATQVIARIARDLGADLPLHCLFENPTVASMAREIDRIGTGSSPCINPRVDTDKIAETLARLDQLNEREIDELLEQLKVRDVLQ